MASTLILDVDDDLHTHLKESAEANHRSLEDAAREILRTGLMKHKRRTANTSPISRGAYQGRSLSVGGEGPDLYATIEDARDRLGRLTGSNDVMIAAAAHVHGDILVTRNIGDFTDCGMVVVKPSNADHP